MTIAAHDPAAEATEILGADFVARVLEPSRPAINAEPFFADDPAAVGTDDDSRTIVSPTSAGPRTWSSVIDERPDLSEWAAERWLTRGRKLPALPADYVAAREGFHRVGYALVAEARRRNTGKFGLRYTRGGFGTPFFGNDEQVRVQAGVLVHQRGDDVAVHPITTLRAAADFLGIEPGTAAAEHDSPELGDLDAELGASTETGIFLGEWFGFAWAAIEELRVSPAAIEPERTQLWPGHFDPAIAMGDADAGSKATYGASPGDHGSDEPYLYVGPWADVDATDEFWNATGFTGAVLPFADLGAADDPVATALSFFRAATDRLA